MFALRTVSQHEPLVNDPYYTWLDANVDRCNPGQRLIRRYLESLGFTIGVDKITEEQYQILEYVEETWFMNTPYHTPMTWDECFTAGTGYYVNGRAGRHNITQELMKAVEESGFIYPVTPDTCYFEVINDRLYAKYQQILGNRFICTIKEAS